jgi:hypothetical protein
MFQRLFIVDSYTNFYKCYKNRKLWLCLLWMCQRNVRCISFI